MFTGKACGKFILLGEHFIVHGGVPALAFPLRSLSTSVDLEIQSATITSKMDLHCRALMQKGKVVEELPEIAKAMMAAIDQTVGRLGLFDDFLKQTGLRLSVTSHCNFPLGRGFGSSASFALAFARAFSEYSQWFARIPEIVQAFEECFHAKPSGIDAATILAGHPIRYFQGVVEREIKNPGTVDFVLVDSGSRDQCRELVQKVSAFREKNPKIWREKAEFMHHLVDSCENALAQKDPERVASCVNTSHEILTGLGLSTPAIESVISHGIASGALAGKVSGAGAGGAVVLVARAGDGQQVARGLMDHGFQVVTLEKAN